MVLLDILLGVCWDWCSRPLGTTAVLECGRTQGQRHLREIH